MRVFIAVLVLIFSLQSWTKADDIRDFEIEGMSIGDSLLNYVGKDKIVKNIRLYYEHFKNDDFYASGFNESFFKVYDAVDIHLKKNDSKYIIYSLDGLIFYEDINICYKKMSSIVKELSNQFMNSNKIDHGISAHEADKSGNSNVKRTSWYLDGKDLIAIECYYWSDQIKKIYPEWSNHLRISATTTELNDWLLDGQY